MPSLPSRSQLDWAIRDARSELDATNGLGDLCSCLEIVPVPGAHHLNLIARPECMSSPTTWAPFLPRHGRSRCPIKTKLSGDWLAPGGLRPGLILMA